MLVCESQFGEEVVFWKVMVVVLEGFVVVGFLLEEVGLGDFEGSLAGGGEGSVLGA